MKKLSKTLFALASFALLTSCGDNTPALDVAKDVFDNGKVYFEVGSEENVSVKIDIAGTISGISCGRTKAEAGQYSYKDGILTLAGGFVSKLTFGEKDIRITADKTTTVKALVCTKIIKTAEDFQNINENLDGTYVLGNDIDLSSIDNFEPLGRYVSEEDTSNHYFHGILEGNGHTVKNATVYWSDSVGSNKNVYGGYGTKFTDVAHVNGDNIGLFQIIGSAGVVRNVNFSNIKVRGRTIVGVIAGNCAGTVYNCTIDSKCKAEMGTHFYDDDCNMGGAFGIVGGSGNVYNVVSSVSDLVLGGKGDGSDDQGVYIDYSDDYKGKTDGNGWDHVNDESCNWWRFCAVDKVDSKNSKIMDSNGAPSNGQYAFVGKCWGSVSNCVAKSFNYAPMNESSRAIYFGQTHLGANKPTSGESDMGTLSNCQMLSDEAMKKAENYSSFDTSVWNIKDGAVPSLIEQYTYLPASQE